MPFDSNPPSQGDRRGPFPRRPWNTLGRASQARLPQPLRSAELRRRPLDVRPDPGNPIEGRLLATATGLLATFFRLQGKAALAGVTEGEYFWATATSEVGRDSPFAANMGSALVSKTSEVVKRMFEPRPQVGMGAQMAMTQESMWMLRSMIREAHDHSFNL